MTNTIAAIIVTIGTNWTTVGTFYPISGPSQDVQQGRIVTNTTAIVEWKGNRTEFVLEYQDGPICGERKLPAKSNWINGTNGTIQNYLIPNQGFLIVTNSANIGL